MPNGEQVKNFFRRQWINGNLENYMKSVKDRVREMWNIDLEYSTPEEFYQALVDHGLLQFFEKE